MEAEFVITAARKKTDNTGDYRKGLSAVSLRLLAFRQTELIRIRFQTSDLIFEIFCAGKSLRL